MRTISTTAISLVLLVAWATSVAAQEEEPEADRTDFVVVTGSSTISAGGSPSGEDRMSDSRVSGHANLTNYYLYGPVDTTGVNWGEYKLTNEDGGWEGEWIGFYEEPTLEVRPMVGTQNAMAWASGTGDYEGWSYVANYTGKILGLDVRGLIYQGPIPPTVTLGLLEAEPE